MTEEEVKGYFFETNCKSRNQVTKSRAVDGRNDHQKRLEYFLETGLISDAILVVGKAKKPMKAHKVILGLGSETFLELFKNFPASTSKFEVPNTEPDEFASFMKVQFLVIIISYSTNVFVFNKLKSKA